MHIDFGNPFLDQCDLKELEVKKCVGRHSELRALMNFAGADMPSNPAHLMGSDLICRFDDGEFQADLFAGTITSVEFNDTTSDGLPRSVLIMAFSDSLKADLVPRCRVFQNPSTTVADIIDQIFQSADYVGERGRGDFTWPMPLSVQFEETDFQYLKRVLTAAGIPLVIDDPGHRILAGNPAGRKHILTEKDIIGNTFFGRIVPLLSQESFATPEGLVGEFQNAASKFGGQLGDRTQYMTSSAHATSRKLSQNTLSVHDAAELAMDTALHRIRTRRVFMAVGDQASVKQDGSYVVASARLHYINADDQKATFNQFYNLAAVQELYPTSEDLLSLSGSFSPPYHLSDHHRSFSFPTQQLSCLEIPWRTTTFVAEVTKNSGDPESLGRIQVRFDWESDSSDMSTQCWVDVLTPYAGQDGQTYGLLMLPEIGEKVLVRFIEPWDDKPLVIGSLRRGTVIDTLDTAQHKSLRTPGGNCIDLVSKPTGESIRLRAGNSDQFHLVCETSNGQTKVTVACNDTLKIKGKKVKISGESVSIKGKESTKITSDRSLSLLSNTGTVLKSSAGVKIKGKLIELN